MIEFCKQKAYWSRRRLHYYIVNGVFAVNKDFIKVPNHELDWETNLFTTSYPSRMSPNGSPSKNSLDIQ